jgi:O-Antigen ligase
MTRRLYSYLLSLALALSLAGYPLGAAIAEILTLNNTALSIIIRLVVGLISVVFILRFMSRSHPKNTVHLLQIALFFWAIYLVRMYHDTVISFYPMFLQPYEYWIWGVGGCVVPMLGFALVTGEERNGLTHFRWQFGFFLAAAILIALTASTVVRTEYGEAATGRLNLTALNPISLGHVGTSLFLLSFWALFCWKFPRNWLATSVHVASGMLGLFLMISSNSRGPLVAFLLPLAVAVVTLKTSKKFAIIILSFFAAAAFVPVVTLIDASFNTVIYDRMLGQSQLEEGNVLDRYERYIIAMESFAEKPFLGFGMEVEAIGGYPHNVVVESFISVGLFGAFIFMALLVILSVKAYAMLNRDTGYGWLSLLYLQYAIGAQFSGAIYSSTIFWATAGALVAAAWPVLAKKSSEQPQRLVHVPAQNDITSPISRPSRWST